MPNRGFASNSGHSVIRHNESAQKAAFNIFIVQLGAAVCSDEVYALESKPATSDRESKWI